MKVSHQEEALERAKQFSEIQAKAKLISCQSELSMKLDRQTQVYESRLRTLICTFMSAFSQFSDLQGELNEESFSQCVKRVKAAFEQYRAHEATIRKLIKADDSQAIDDALTHFIISQHPRLKM
jgi:type I site-specific restriction endonuclease